MSSVPNSFLPDKMPRRNNHITQDKIGDQELSSHSEASPRGYAFKLGKSLTEIARDNAKAQQVLHGDSKKVKSLEAERTQGSTYYFFHLNNEDVRFLLTEIASLVPFHEAKATEIEFIQDS